MGLELGLKDLQRFYKVDFNKLDKVVTNKEEENPGLCGLTQAKNGNLSRRKGWSFVLYNTINSSNGSIARFTLALAS